MKNIYLMSKEEHNLENIRNIVQSMKKILSNCEYEFDWTIQNSDTVNIFRAKETYILMFTFSILNSISIKLESVQSSKYIEHYYKSIDEILLLWNANQDCIIQKKYNI